MDTKNTIKTLSQSLLDEVKKIMKKEKGEKSEKGESEADEKRENCSEALKGDQHKIDANKNGKIDSHDFKLLRKKKGVAETYAALKTGEEISEEEVEEAVKNPYAVGMAAAMKSTGDKPPLKKSTIVKAHKIAKKIDEEAEELDELSKGTLASYIKKAVPSKRGLEDSSDRLHQKGHDAYTSGATKTSDKMLSLSAKQYNKSLRRGEGINKAADKLAKEEFEQIDEISAKTVDSYREKAYAQQPAGDDGSNLYKKRKAGRDMAFKKVTHGAKVPATNEEFEQIDELSKDTVSKYANKAFDQSNSILKSRNMDLPKSVKKSAEDAKERRRKGIVSAGKRLGDDEMKKIAQSSANRIVYNREDVELTQEEIDRLDAIMADLDEARGRPPKEGSDAWKRQQAAGASEQDEPRQHPIQQLERIKRDMRGGDVFKHKDGTTSKLSGAHASKLLDKYHGLKPSGKEDMQKEIHASQAGLKKHL